MQPELTFRPVEPGDEVFLYELYASTRQAELSAWGWPPEQQAMFLKLQFTAQQNSYAFQFPQAVHALIYRGDQAIGRWLVNYNPAEIRLVDITLAPVYHNNGLGTQLLGRLMTEAATTGRPLRLSVLQTNPARRLYERLGFIALPAAPEDPYLALEYRA